MGIQTVVPVKRRNNVTATGREIPEMTGFELCEEEVKIYSKKKSDEALSTIKTRKHLLVNGTNLLVIKEVK
ncbi:hypothetical protein TNCV_2814591 [Trichonephila clavipes]|nr:hypothetical protein TNCV_2814591 [Trichonephila clavipes]